MQAYNSLFMPNLGSVFLFLVIKNILLIKNSKFQKKKSFKKNFFFVSLVIFLEKLFLIGLFYYD